MPLFVRAGSIVPMCPDMEWTSEKPANPIELRIYRGADGDFTLYEDEGDSYDYEKGVCSTISFHWDEKAQQLAIVDRKG
jgi:alpha-D-xyloside xylohydrolase